MGDLTPILRRPEDGRIVSLGTGGEVTLKVEREDSSGSMTAYEFTVPPRTAGPPIHIHRTWDELFFVLEGEMTFLLDEETHTAPMGSTVFIPRGRQHTFWNAGDVPARQLTVFTPSGIENYFDAVSADLVRGGEESIDAARELMRQHDMIVPEQNGPAYGSFN